MAPIRGSEMHCFNHHSKFRKVQAAARQKAGESTKLTKRMDAAMAQFGYDVFVLLTEALGRK